MLDLLQKRRSVRHFIQSPIESDMIEDLAKAALLSPSSRGTRPWEFVFVTEPKILEELSRAKDRGSSFLAAAPLAIVVLADPVKCDVWIEDASIATIIIQLAAESIGLSSCWIQIRERKHSEDLTSEAHVRAILEVPNSYRVLSMIAVGYADETKIPSSLDELDRSKIHTNRFSGGALY